MNRPSVSRMREIRTSGLKGDLRKRSQSATAPEVNQWRLAMFRFTIRNLIWLTVVLALGIGLTFQESQFDRTLCAIRCGAIVLLALIEFNPFNKRARRAV